MEQMREKYESLSAFVLDVYKRQVTDKAGNNNIITVAWAGTVCTNPPMLSISVTSSGLSSIRRIIRCISGLFTVTDFATSLSNVVFPALGLSLIHILYQLLFFHLPMHLPPLEGWLHS